MAQQFDPDNLDERSSTGSNVPIEEVEIEAETPDHPRRAASAEFVVKAEAGSASILREAMDPANQSLADALKLSYRVLQFVIIILVVLFLVSGFRSVESDQTGVQTRFGRIVRDGGTGSAELTPGLQVSIWPYPISEFIVFDQSAVVDLSQPFWPHGQIGARRNFEEAAPGVQAFDPFKLGTGLGRDGYLLLFDKDSGPEVGHIQLTADFSIDDAEQFATRLGVGGSADGLVRMALQRGAVHTAARLDLDGFLGQEEILAAAIREQAQAMLDELETGISVKRVQLTSARAPLAVHTVLGALGTARTQADSIRTTAATASRKRLNELAGENYQELLGLIENYEQLLLSSPDQAVMYSEEAQSLLTQIDEFLQSDRAGGAIKTEIESARAYEAEIKLKLGAHERRFSGLLPQYRANPEYVIKTQWIEAFNNALAQETAETFRIPADSGSIHVSITGDQTAMLKKRAYLQGLRTDASRAASGLDRRRELQMGEGDTNRQLMIGEQGEVRGPNE